MMFFWFIAACLIAVAFYFVLPTLLKHRQEGDLLGRDALNVEIHRDQMNELKVDLQSGTLSQEQFDQAHDDLERSLLEGVSGVSDGDNTTAEAISGKASAWFAILAIPLVSIMIYLQIGGGSEAINAEPAGPSQAATQSEQAHDIQATIVALRKRLESQPDDIEGWVMLARSYYFVKEFNGAAESYAKAVALTNEQDADLLADYADSLAVASGRQLSGKPMEMVRKAIAVNPTHVKALWLAGTGAYQMEDYAQARDYWQRILPLLPPNSENALALQGAIAEVSEKLGEPVPVPELAAAAGFTIEGVAQLDSKYADKPSPEDTVFVFARAASGPRMPLAIVRKQVKDLPFKFTLDDSTAMNPSMKISNFKEVVVGARISKSGTAMPQSGDLQGSSSVIKQGNIKDLRIVINSIIE
jgi:cytochrome c-type biogenesis protein CcmH